MMNELIQQNYIGIATLSLFILFVITNNNFERRLNSLFLGAAVCVLLLILEETWEVWLSMKETYDPLRVLLSSIGYTLRPVIPYLLVLMVRSIRAKETVLISIPLIVNSLVSFSALFCKLAFWYSPDNQFFRGPLGFIPFVTAGFYVALLFILALRENRKGGLMEAMIVTAIVLLAVVSTVMESLFKFRGIQTASIGISITFYYLFLHTNFNNRDPLTGALTRRRFYLDAKRYRASLTAVISLDVNNLKEINDQRGHLEGDKALIAVTGIVKRHMGSRASFFRIGGDEFMILCYKLEEQKVRELIQRIRADFEKTEYRCAIGYAPYSYQMELDRACQAADKAMYENKREMKKKQLALAHKNSLVT